MADQVLVASCRVVDFDAASGTCSAVFYSAPESSMPTLSIADAQSIGLALALLWGSAFGLRMIRKALNEIG